MKSEERDFDLDTLGNGEQEEVLVDGGDVVAGVEVGQEGEEEEEEEGGQQSSGCVGACLGLWKMSRQCCVPERTYESFGGREGE